MARTAMSRPVSCACIAGVCLHCRCCLQHRDRQWSSSIARAVYACGGVQLQPAESISLAGRDVELRPAILAVVVPPLESAL